MVPQCSHVPRTKRCSFAFTEFTMTTIARFIGLSRRLQTPCHCSLVLPLLQAKLISMRLRTYISRTRPKHFFTLVIRLLDPPTNPLSTKFVGVVLLNYTLDLQTAVIATEDGISDCSMKFLGRLVDKDHSVSVTTNFLNQHPLI
jgi:hypothetical protein